MEVNQNDITDLASELGRIRSERDALRLRLAEVERDERASFAAAETEHANKWAQRCDTLRAQIATVATERDDARRVAKRLARTGREGCATDADRDAFDSAVRTALAYEVEP